MEIHSENAEFSRRNTFDNMQIFQERKKHSPNRFNGFNESPNWQKKRQFRLKITKFV